MDSCCLLSKNHDGMVYSREASYWPRGHNVEFLGWYRQAHSSNSVRSFTQMPVLLSGSYLTNRGVVGRTPHKNGVPTILGQRLHNREPVWVDKILAVSTGRGFGALHTGVKGSRHSETSLAEKCYYIHLSCDDDDGSVSFLGSDDGCSYSHFFPRTALVCLRKRITA